MIIHYWAHLSFYCVSHAHQSTSSTTYRQSNIMRKATQIDPNKRKGQWILYHLTLRMAVSLLFYSPRVSIQATPAWSEEHCLGRGPKVEEVKLVMIDDLDNLLPILCRMRYTKVSNLGLTRACHVTCRKRKKGDLAATSLDSLMGLPQSTSVTTLLQHNRGTPSRQNQENPSDTICMTFWLSVAWEQSHQTSRFEVRNGNSTKNIKKHTCLWHVHDKLPNCLTMTLYK